MEAWLRDSDAETMSSPSLLIRFLCASSSRARTSSGSQSASRTLKRNSTFVFTLLTFCPPGPLERECVISILARGTKMRSGAAAKPRVTNRSDSMRARWPRQTTLSVTTV